ncbi:hypothetical protein [Rhodococcus triatomae]|nr:hypothetical protein [Rhodococcus triatomae]
MLITRAEQRCEACGSGEDRAARRWLEAHERWNYDNASLTQSLRRLIVLCTPCHQATHFGLAQLRGHDVEALTHLSIVTRMNRDQANAHVSDAFRLWNQRSQYAWHLDLSILINAGIGLQRPPSPQQRVEAAIPHTSGA